METRNITFLFTDIEQSTRLAQRLREHYPRILEQHRSLIREVIREYEGREIDVAGDGFFITYKEPEKAILSAVEIQRRLRIAAWAQEVGLKVRIGIHAGEALQTSTGYTGVQVHCASRICDSGHGGQILVSQEVREMASPEFLEETSMSVLGDFMFKDFHYPCEIYQVHVPGDDSIFPDLRLRPVDKRLAVMPFTGVRADDPASQWGDGIAEELTTALSKFHGMRVITSIPSYVLEASEYSRIEAAKLLKATIILTGELCHENGQVNLDVHLIDTNLGQSVWNKQFSADAHELTAMQDDITSKIVEALECRFSSIEDSEIKRRQTDSIEAYDFYLRGRRFYLQFSTVGMKYALQMFERAVEHDPGYALAFAGIADAHSYLYQHMEPSASTLQKADAASLRAVQLGPCLGEAFTSRANVLALKHNLVEAEEYYKKALDCDPSLFLGWFQYGRMCMASGQLDKATRLFDQASKVQPDDYQSVLLSAQTYEALGSKTLAQTLRQRGVEIASRWIDLNPGDTRALTLAANALASLDQKQKSLKLLKQALTLEPDDSMVLYNAGCTYALLGMENEAMHCLERAYDRGLTLRGWYEHDGNLESIRSSERFKALMARMTVAV